MSTYAAECKRSRKWFAVNRWQERRSAPSPFYNKGIKANWSTKWVSDDINVSVKEGIATLTGKVDTWHQRSEAADVAFTTKGVWGVKNKLAVEGYDYDWDAFDYYGFPYRYSFPW